MQALYDLIENNEIELTQKVITYLKERGYVQNTSTLMEAWRLSIFGISNIILSLLKTSEKIPELEPDINYAENEVFSFGISEARLHRNRGIDYVMFAGSFKYYRQAYCDLIVENCFEKEYEDYCLAFVNRCFDQIELGFSTEWLNLKEADYIEDLQTANRAMTNEKNKYLTIFESYSIPIVILDNDCNIDSLNFAAAQLFQDTIIPGSSYYGSVLRNKPFSWFSHELSLFVNNSQKQFGFETSLATKKGKKNFQVIFTRMLDVSDKFKGTIITLHDITERKIMEKEMARLGRLELIGQMAAGIGHEIRNPMTTVRGFLQMLSSKDQHKRHKELFELLIQELDRCNSIITEYLSLAKNKRVNLQTNNLNTIIEAILPLLKSDANKRENVILFNKENIPDLLLDEKEIRQLIINLVNNGLQAMDSKGILTIRTHVNNRHVILSIEDQGKGIPPELIDKIGNPFITTKTDGVGLGLAICHSIVARHKALLDFSTGTNGTTFFVRFKINR